MFGLDAVLIIVIVIATLAVSVTLHEYMHGFVAYKLGDNTAKFSGRLTLNPIAHIDPFATVLLPVMLALLSLPPFGAAKPVPFNPSNLRNGETGLVMVALAGPLTNLVLAAVGGFLFQVLPVSFFTSQILPLFIILNLAFFVFNMIPFPPLDGSRLLYVLSPEPVRRFMQSIEQAGLIGIALFIFIGYRFLFPLLSQAISVLSRWLTGVDLLLY